MKLRIISLATAVTFGLAGCSFEASIGGPSVSADELEKQVAAELEEEIGRDPGDVSCPDSLDGEVDATTTCTLTDAGTEYDVEVTVTEVTDDKVLFNAEVQGADSQDGDSEGDSEGDSGSEEQQIHVAQADVEQHVADQLEAEVGQRPDAIDCPGDLAGEVGTEMTCTLTAGTDQLDVYLTVTEVLPDEQRVLFDINVQDTPPGE